MAHVNPGMDTTINPIVIDDSFRSKPTKSSTIEVWAIKAPDGKFYGRLNYESEDHCIYEWSQGMVEYWDHCLSVGYRCVRVSIQEIESTAAKEA